MSGEIRTIETFKYGKYVAKIKKHGTCKIDSTDLADDVAMINEAYRRCKMLTESAMMALTETIVVLAGARD